MRENITYLTYDIIYCSLEKSLFTVLFLVLIAVSNMHFSLKRFVGMLGFWHF